MGDHQRYNGGWVAEASSADDALLRMPEEEEEEDIMVLKKGPWTKEEDEILIRYLNKKGIGNWNSIHKYSGLARSGKSCRLRWYNQLRPNLKKGSFTPEEENLIVRMHANHGNKWTRIASKLPGRTDNEIKNFWNTRLKRCLKKGLPVYPENREQQQSPINELDNDTNNWDNNNSIENISNNNNNNNDCNPNLTPKSYTPSTQHPLSLPLWHNLLSSPVSTQTLPSAQHRFPLSLPLQPPPSSPCHLLSTHQLSHTYQSTLPPQTQVSAPHKIHFTSLQQSSSMYDTTFALTPLRDPPILSSPERQYKRFRRAASGLSQVPMQSQLSPPLVDHSLSTLASSISLDDLSSYLNLDSSTPISSLLLEGLTSPLNLQTQNNPNGIVSLGSSFTLHSSPLQSNYSYQQP